MTVKKIVAPLAATLFLSLSASAYATHVVPLKAKQIKTSLVQAYYLECGGNGPTTHSEPLHSYASAQAGSPEACSPALHGLLTQGPNSTATAIMTVIGSPTKSEDITFTFRATDINDQDGFENPGGVPGPYTGPATGVVGLRITDDDCASNPCTVRDIPFSFPSPAGQGCVAGSCSIKTSANAVLGGAIKPQKGMVIGVGFRTPLYEGPIQILDLFGAPFLESGLFVP